jgi:hypothetical protein
MVVGTYRTPGSVSQSSQRRRPKLEAAASARDFTGVIKKQVGQHSLAQPDRFLMETNHSVSNLIFDMNPVFIVNYFLLIDDVPVNNKTLLKYDKLHESQD